MSEKHNKAIAILTGIYTTLTLIIAVSAIVSNYNTSKEIKDSKRTSQRTLEKMDSATFIENRAFIQIQGGVQNTFMLDTKSLTLTNVYASIKNSGKTPAYNIKIKYNVTIDSTHFDTITFKHGMNASIMGAEQTYEPSFIVDSIPIVDFFVVKQHCFIYGKITYNDFFRKKHFLNFYFKVFPIRFTSNPIPNIGALLKTLLNKEGTVAFIAMDKYNEGN